MYAHLNTHSEDTQWAPSTTLFMHFIPGGPIGHLFCGHEPRLH